MQALILLKRSGASMNASPNLSTAIGFSEQKILGERLWMLAVARQLTPYHGENGWPHELKVRPPIPDVDGYLEAAGPIPDYNSDPLGAERHHDELASWFWSAYAVALARMDINAPLTDSARCVIDRLRAKALRLGSRSEAA